MTRGCWTIFGRWQEEGKMTKLNNICRGGSSWSAACLVVLTISGHAHQHNSASSSASAACWWWWWSLGSFISTDLSWTDELQGCSDKRWLTLPSTDNSVILCVDPDDLDDVSGSTWPSILDLLAAHTRWWRWLVHTRPRWWRWLVDTRRREGDGWSCGATPSAAAARRQAVRLLDRTVSLFHFIL